MQIINLLAPVINFIGVAISTAVKALNVAFSAINKFLDIALLWIGLLGLLAYLVIYIIRNLRKYQKKDENYKKNLGEVIKQAIILFVAEIFIIIAFGIIPQYLHSLPHWSWLAPTLRWLEFFGIVIFIVHLFAHEYGEKRWIYSCAGHLGVLLLGWLIGSWVGILFISMPLILAFYVSLYRLAMVILPTSNPEDKKERWKRFIVLVSYAWGIQLPILVVSQHAWKKPDLRIPGDFTWDYPVPGLVWTKSHHVAAITAGTSFKRVDGPGVVFTGKLERPLQIVDLRLQLRTSEIDVVSKDGINFKVRVSTAFRIDPDTWDKEMYDKLRPLNPLLRGADKPSYTDGSFPFSTLRIQATLGTTSTRATAPDAIPWDQWVLNTVENAARKVVSQKTLDEFWRPLDDKKEVNALELIAQEIKSAVFLPLRAAGILVFSARIVNFRFPGKEGETDQVSKQQIATWGSEWDRKRNKILDEAQAESDKAQQEARAYAESLLLTSIAEGLQKTQEMHPRLPRYVIAVRFLSALQDYIQNRPKETDTDSENDKRVDELQTFLRGQQDLFLPGSDKGKS